MPNTNIQTLRRKLTAQRSIGEKWRVIGLSYPSVAYGTLSRIVNDPNYEPKNNAIRRALGLPTHSVTVEPLPCGCPPTGTRCKVHRKPSTRKPDPVVRVKRVDEARITALSALYASRGIGDARYRAELKRTLDSMMG